MPKNGGTLSLEGGKKQSDLQEVPNNESKGHFGLQRMQAAQLQHHEEQEERPGQARDEQVLQILQEAHCS